MTKPTTWRAQFVPGRIHLEAAEASLKGIPESGPNGIIDSLMRSALIGHTAALNALLNRGVDVNSKDADGRTALMEAAFAGHAAAVQVLVDRGADVNSCDNDGWTALMEAASKGRVAAVRALLDAGADPYQSSRSGWTARKAAVRDHTEIMRMLKKAERCSAQ